MRFILVQLFLFVSLSGFTQYTTEDSLRGGYGHSRDWWDVTHYDLSVDFDIEKQQISGCNVITFNSTEIYPVLDEYIERKNEFQIDLQSPMVIDSIFMDKHPVDLKTIRQVGS